MREARPLPGQELPYDLNLGSGFWWANSLNVFTRNVAVECDQDGYRFEVPQTDAFEPTRPVRQPDGTAQPRDLRTVPFIRFEDNEAHRQRLFGLNLGGRSIPSYEDKFGPDAGGIGPDKQHPFLIRNFRCWDTHWSLHTGVSNVKLDGLDFFRDIYGMWRCVGAGLETRRLRFELLDTSILFPRGSTGLASEQDFLFNLAPKDDLPPFSVITSVERTASGQCVVRGVAGDDYAIRKVTVNGQAAHALRPNFAEWEVTLGAADAVVSRGGG